MAGREIRFHGSLLDLADSSNGGHATPLGTDRVLTDEAPGTSACGPLEVGYDRNWRGARHMVLDVYYGTQWSAPCRCESAAG